MTALRALLAGSIDYAGLFPPAGLDMATAAGNYARYLEGDTRWALGRFVVPATRLRELEKAAENMLPSRPSGEPWRLTVLLGADLPDDLRSIEEFNCRHASDGSSAVAADVVEARAASVEAVSNLLTAMPDELQAYVEVPSDPDPAPLMSAIADHRGRAKIRTGGVTPDAFPPARQVVRFIARAVESNVPFKATAGLHHPLRADYPLTYEPDSPRGTMFGFLNLFLAAAFMARGMDAEAAGRLLEETSPGSLTVLDETIEWRGHRLGIEDIHAARGRTIVSFGSCSFAEPVGELAALGLL